MKQLLYIPGLRNPKTKISKANPINVWPCIHPSCKNPRCPDSEYCTVHYRKPVPIDKIPLIEPILDSNPNYPAKKRKKRKKEDRTGLCLFPSCENKSGFAGSLYCEYHYREEMANSK